MMILGERVDESVFVHNHETCAIHKAPFFISPAFIQFESKGEQIRTGRDYLNIF